jgi:hypothetical protein
MVKNGGVNTHYWERKMPNKVPAKVAELLQKVGETPATALWDCHGTYVVYHKALEKIADHLQIKFDDPVVLETDIKNKCVAIMVRGYQDKRTEWSIGEATPYNNKNGYPFAMAEKRAKDRVILKLVGIAGDVYSSEEADDFKQSNPANRR